MKATDYNAALVAVGATHGDPLRLKALLPWLARDSHPYHIATTWLESTSLSPEFLASLCMLPSEAASFLAVAQEQDSDTRWHAAMMMVVRSYLLGEIADATSNVRSAMNVTMAVEALSHLVPPDVTLSRTETYNIHDLLTTALAENEPINLGKIADDLGLYAEAGNFITIGARPAIGKTALGLRIALERAHMDLRTHMLSFEMSPRQLGVRIASVVLGRPLELINDSDLLKVSRDPEVISASKYLFTHTISGGLDKITSDIMPHVQPGDVVIIDHLHMMRVPQRKSLPEELGHLTSSLKALALEKEIVLLVLAQLGRGSDQAPMLSDLRWSGSIETDSDAVLLLHSDGEHTIANLAKNRQGRVCSVTLPREWQFLDRSRIHARSQFAS